MIKYLICETKH